MNDNIQEVIGNIENFVKPYFGQGKKADYIPALDKVDANQFALSIVTSDKTMYSIGSDHISFSIQSVSKVFTLTLALSELDNELWKRMFREPSGKSFDSLIHLEESCGMPSNPFLNSGAIVLADILLDIYGANAFTRYMELMKEVSGNQDLEIDLTVYQSEKETGHKNYSFAHYMKSFGNIKNSVNDVVELYFKFCSLSVSNIDLAKAFYFLSNKGVSLSGKQITSHRHCKRINSLMFTSGTYNEVGDFAYLVGLPLKSGVSGAIAGCLPSHYSVSVWSPELNVKGNSLVGLKALEELTTRLDTSFLS